VGRSDAKYAEFGEICGIYANFRICSIISAYAILKTQSNAEKYVTCVFYKMFAYNHNWYPYSESSLMFISSDLCRIIIIVVITTENKIHLYYISYGGCSLSTAIQGSHSFTDKKSRTFPRLSRSWIFKEKKSKTFQEA